MTGHSDGHVRFIDDKTLLVNSLAQELKYWQDGFKNMIKDSGLSYIEMPWFSYSDKNHKESAMGIYVIGNLIVFPVFEIDDNKDKEALKVISEAFPTHIISIVLVGLLTYNLHPRAFPWSGAH